MQKKSGLHALLAHKCPRCRQGDLYTYRILEAPLKFDKMNSHCLHCGVRFEKEPGFFFGAMFVSYAINVAILIITFCLLYFVFNDPALWVYIVTVPVLVALLLPLIFRFSRTLYLYGVGDIRYDNHYAEKVN
jgi:uncharacterized protein (DUF983 family)